MSDVSREGPTLVVLAAGMGSRFGGTKQLVGVGPADETIMDYSVHEAVRAGFARVVLVVRTAIADAVAEQVSRWPSTLPVALVAQDDAEPKAPEGRSKPAGTGHAVLVARPHVPGDFAVINADDLYAPSSYRLLVDHLAGDDRRHAIVGFQARATLLGPRPVTRALLRVDDGRLVDIVEGKVTHTDDGGLRWDEVGGELSLDLAGDEPVSMNCFGFRPSVFDALDLAWKEFEASGAAAADGELFLPAVVRSLVGPGRDGVVALAGEGCLGVTHGDDLGLLRDEVAGLVERGVLPRRLWG